MRAKVFLECARSAQSYCIYASESITKMRAKRAKHAKSLLICARSARKYCWSACESTSVLRAKRAKVLLEYSCLFNSSRIYKVGVEERTLFRILFYCTRSDEHSEWWASEPAHLGNFVSRPDPTRDGIFLMENHQKSAMKFQVGTSRDFCVELKPTLTFSILSKPLNGRTWSAHVIQPITVIYIYIQYTTNCTTIGRIKLL